MDGELAERRVRGLKNLGNLCFVNSVLQCLAACQPFFRFLSALRRTSLHPKMKTLAELVSFISEVADEDVELGLEQQNTKKGDKDRQKAIRSSMLSGVVNEWVPDDPVRPMGGKARQEDAQEFLTYLLNSLHNELAPHMEGEAAVQQPSAQDGAEDAINAGGQDDDGWLHVGGKGGAKKTAVRKVHFCFSPPDGLRCFL